MKHLKAKNVQILELVDHLSQKLASMQESPSQNMHHYISGNSHLEKSSEERRISRSLDEDEDESKM